MSRLSDSYKSGGGNSPKHLNLKAFNSPRLSNAGSGIGAMGGMNYSMGSNSPENQNQRTQVVPL